MEHNSLSVPLTSPPLGTILANGLIDLNSEVLSSQMRISIDGWAIALACTSVNRFRPGLPLKTAKLNLDCTSHMRETYR
jgi:hypothetical protein